MDPNERFVRDQLVATPIIAHRPYCGAAASLTVRLQRVFRF